MSHLPAVAKSVLLNLLALTAAAALILTTGCSGNEQVTKTQPSQTEQALAEKIERQDDEIASLRRELEKLQSTEEQQTKQPTQTHTPAARVLEAGSSRPTNAPEAGSSRPTNTPEPSSSKPTNTSEPTPSAINIPTPSGPGICGRSPELQEAILSKLNVSYCQPVNEAELFRINGEWSVRLEEVRPGDFQGLINITSISVHAKDIRAGAFAGLENLKTMKLNVHRYGSIAPGAWKGLDKLEVLSIESTYPSEGEEGRPILTLPDFQHLPSLNDLRINGWSYLRADTISETLFSNLPDLEVLLLEKLKAEGKEEDMHIPGRLFLNNIMLREVGIGIHYAPSTRVLPARGHVRQ